MPLPDTDLLRRLAELERENAALKAQGCAPTVGTPNDNFPAAVEFTLQYEGGFVNHPADPGGATNLGITLATLSAYRGKECTEIDVRKLQRAEAVEIYRKNYADTVSFDKLPKGVDLCVFDFAVNSGPVRAKRYLQHCLGVAPDGIFGPITFDALDDFAPTIIIDRYCDNRLSFLKGLETFNVFGKGWTARVAACRAKAKEMAG